MPRIIEILSSRKILFGHASVGNDIIAGMEELSLGEPILKIITTRSESDFTLNGLYHFIVGKNTFPKSKCDAFREFLLQSERGTTFNIAFFKFCFVDFDEHSDVQAIFTYYTETISAVQARFPELVILHVTTPLTTHSWGIRSRIRNLVKGDPANEKRNKFNDLLLDRYKSQVFNLAGVESTRPDGERVTFSHNGMLYYSLYNPYASDSGHLNKLGRRTVAAAMLHFLADHVLERTKDFR
jgi:hypothetical protein